MQYFTEAVNNDDDTINVDARTDMKKRAKRVIRQQLTKENHQASRL